MTQYPSPDHTDGQRGSINIAPGSDPEIAQYMNVAINPSTFTLQAGNTQSVSVKFTFPNDIDTSTFPVLSGFIEITSNSESLQPRCTINESLMTRCTRMG